MANDTHGRAGSTFWPPHPSPRKTSLQQRLSGRARGTMTATGGRRGEVPWTFRLRRRSPAQRRATAVDATEIQQIRRVLGGFAIYLASKDGYEPSALPKGPNGRSARIRAGLRLRPPPRRRYRLDLNHRRTDESDYLGDRFVHHRADLGHAGSVRVERRCAPPKSDWTVQWSRGRPTTHGARPSIVRPRRVRPAGGVPPRRERRSGRRRERLCVGVVRRSAEDRREMLPGAR